MLNDLKALCVNASGAAGKAVAVSDALHIELAHTQIKEIWPNAKSWDRQYEVEDGIGNWYLTEIKLEDDSIVDLYPGDPTSEHEEKVEGLNNVLSDLWSEEEHGTIARVEYP